MAFKISLVYYIVILKEKSDSIVAQRIMFLEIKNQYFGSSLASSNIKAINAYGWGVKFKKGSIQNFLVGNFGVFHLGTRIRNRILGEIFDKRDLSKNNLLDAGCGIGLASIYYSPRFASVTGVDLEKHKIDQAKSLAKSNHIKNVNFRTANLIDMPFTKNKFETIICFEVIEHVSDDKKLIKCLSQLLKKDGEIILSFPSKTLMSKIAQKSLDHFKVGYVPNDIKEILKPLNLKIVEEYSFGKSILGKSVVFVDFLLRKSAPMIASAFFTFFYPLMIIDYYLPEFGIPRGYILVIKRK